MSSTSEEVLRARATFMCLSSVLNVAKQNELTGSVRVDWNAQDARLKQCVGDEILPAKILQVSTGVLTIKDGIVVGARIGEWGRADLEASLDALMQMCYGIGCGVLASTVLTLTEYEITEADIAGKVADLDFMSRIVDLESSVGQRSVGARRVRDEAELFNR